MLTKPKRGRPKLGHVQYKRNINPKFVQQMDEFLNKLKRDEANR